MYNWLIKKINIRFKRSREDSLNKKSRWEEFITLFTEFMQ